MADPASNDPAPTIAEVWGRRAQPFGTGGLVILGSACTAVGVGMGSKDWCWSTVGSACLTAIIIFVLNSFFLAPIARLHSWGRKIQAAVPLVIAGLFTAVFWLDEARVFQEILGPNPPSGIRDCEVISNQPDPFFMSNNYLLRFTATPEAIEQLVDRGALRRNQVIIATWQTNKQTWETLLKQVFENGPAGWASIKPMSQPVVFHGEPEAGGIITVLWDSASGLAYGVFTHT
jgi:hypothetical protein